MVSAAACQIGMILIYDADDTILPHDYPSLLMHTSLFTILDILHFLHKLPSYLQSNPKVLPCFTMLLQSLDTDKLLDRSSRAQLLFIGLSFVVPEHEPRQSDRTP